MYSRHYVDYTIDMDDSVTTPDGHEIELLSAEPPGARRVCIIAHGLTGDRHQNGMFDRLSERLAETGSACVRFDFRGHGTSRIGFEQMTLSGEAIDLEAVMNAVDHYPELTLIGHSLGATIIGLLPESRRVRASKICLLAPVTSIRHTFLDPEPDVPWTVDNFGRERLEEHLRRRQPLPLDESWAGGRYFFGEAFLREAFTLECETGLRGLKQPVMVVQGEADQEVSRQRAVRLAGSLPQGRLVSFPDADHCFTTPSGQPDVLLDEVTQFLADLAPAPDPDRH